MDRYSIEKVANAIILALNLGVEYLGKTKLMKLLFFADKEHLKRYGRPIFFDNYVKEKMGPIPEITFGIISAYNNTEKEDVKEELEELLKWIEIKEKEIGYEKPMITFEKKRDFNKNIFSESELEVLKEVFSKYKNSKADELSRISHELPEYRKVKLYECIPYSEMAEDMKEYVSFWEKEKNAFRKALSDF